MKKVVIGIVVVVLAALIAVCVIVGGNYLRVNKYSSAETYEMRSDSIPSVAKVVGTGKLKKATYTKDRANDYDTLTLTYEDSNAKESTAKYIEYLKENDNYLDVETTEQDTRKITESSVNSEDVITVETKLTENGYILKIEVGKGYIMWNNANE